MRLAKVTAGHWKDEGAGAGFNKRYEFAEDLVNSGKVAISFLHRDGHPFHGDLTTDEIMGWSRSEIKEMYMDLGYSENEAGNTASQLVRFRDWPIGTPIFLYLGRNMVYQLGYLRGSYEYLWDSDFHGNNSEYNHPHTREVAWGDAPKIFSRKKLPEEFQGWLSNPQTVVDFDVEPGSDAADFLALAAGIWYSLSGLSEPQLKILQ